MPRPNASRKNLEPYVPKRLGDEPTVAVATKLPANMVQRLDELRGDQTRSAYLRTLITHALSECSST